MPSVMAEVAQIAEDCGWRYERHERENGTPWVKLSFEGDTYYPEPVEILCYSDAFNDIACRTTLVVGMAGLAVDQAMAIGKPIVQIAGGRAAVYLCVCGGARPTAGDCLCRRLASRRRRRRY